MSTILIVIVVLILVGVLPTWGLERRLGLRPGGRDGPDSFNPDRFALDARPLISSLGIGMTFGNRANSPGVLTPPFVDMSCPRNITQVRPPRECEGVTFPSSRELVVMPITKQQSEVPGESEQVAALHARIDQLEKENRELREAAKGNIVQASSESLHNYPDAEVKMREQDPEQLRTPQPRTGASATAKEE